MYILSVNKSKKLKNKIIEMQIKSNIMDIDDAKSLFGEGYENEAILVSKIIEERWWMIVSCGSSASRFAEYCKYEIEEHYKQFPDEKFVGIYFKKENLGYDNWTVERIFKYEKRNL
jgi:hypothetical protein